MVETIRVWFAIVLLSVAVVSNASDEHDQQSGEKVRAELAPGYSLLYQEAKGIPKLDWLLKFKSKPDRLGHLVEQLVNFYDDLAQRMERLSKQYPSLRIDAKPMSDIESEARKSIGADLAKDLAPITGKSGLEFERETLLMFYDSLNEQRHLAEVMSAREPDPGLKKFLGTTKTQLDTLYAKVGALLGSCCFRH
jgi:hypothetical protein